MSTTTVRFLFVGSLRDELCQQAWAALGGAVTLSVENDALTGSDNGYTEHASANSVASCPCGALQR